jgi:hypothetical protein
MGPGPLPVALSGSPARARRRGDGRPLGPCPAGALTPTRVRLGVARSTAAQKMRLQCGRTVLWLKAGSEAEYETRAWD